MKKSNHVALEKNRLNSKQHKQSVIALFWHYHNAGSQNKVFQLKSFAVNFECFILKKQ